MNVAISSDDMLLIRLITVLAVQILLQKYFPTTEIKIGTLF